MSAYTLNLVSKTMVATYAQSFGPLNVPMAGTTVMTVDSFFHSHFLYVYFLQVAYFFLFYVQLLQFLLQLLVR